MVYLDTEIYRQNPLNIISHSQLLGKRTCFCPINMILQIADYASAYRVSFN